MTRVIKIGGRPQSDPTLISAIAQASAANPGSLVIVHGGGDEISRLQTLYDVTAEFKNGLRVTSALDLEIVRMALSGSANKRLVSQLVSVGVHAIGLSGEDAALLVAEPLDPNTYGFVGVPESVNVALLQLLLSNGYCPVISPVSRSNSNEGGTTLNVNGDDAAASVAIALKATELLLVSDVEGVRAQDSSMAARLDEDEAQQLIDNGTAQGGMSAKLAAAQRAIQGGVQQVRISDIAAIASMDRGTVMTRSVRASI